jgi:glyoxylase-like metal-dependent hydrolase (beta-lactamase superfamily II)
MSTTTTTPTRIPAPASPAALSHLGLIDVTPDVACLQVTIVNVVFIGPPGVDDWVLVDAGVPMTAARIRAAAAERYGPHSRPRAIVLTHAHFDHVGALQELAEQWDVPIYAHRLEIPYLTDRSAYPPPDPSVGGGIMPRLALLFPRGPYHVDAARVRELPGDGTVPHLPGWRWVFTPGHTPGHVALFRDADRTLIAGDAFVTTKQESLLAVMTQVNHVHGPPKYWTQDWGAAGHSVRTLAALEPRAAVTGHGLPMRGQRLDIELKALALNFEHVAIPARGRYVNAPAIADERGTVSVPPPVADPMLKVAVGVAVAGVCLALMRNRNRDRD